MTIIKYRPLAQSYLIPLRCDQQAPDSFLVRKTYNFSGAEDRPGTSLTADKCFYQYTISSFSQIIKRRRYED